MRLKTIALGAAAVAMATTPVLATEIAAERSSAPVSGEQELAGSSLIIALVAAAAVIAGIIIIADDDDEPTSP